MTDKTGRHDLRDLIGARDLISLLDSHVRGEREMTASQVSAALALLKKILPDPSGAREETGEHEDRLEDLG
jgi:hypothetical protein